jgi:hypothetical protein
MDKTETPHMELAHLLAGQFSAYPIVEAIGLAGSQTTGAGDAGSDIDLYIYTTALIPLSQREAIVSARGSTRSDMNLTLWDLGDEWFDSPTGIEVDIIYWSPSWITGQIDRVLVQHQASLGYSTCFWHTIRNSQVLFDRNGWLGALKAKTDQPYPETLRQAIIAKNHSVLRRVIPAYQHQIAKAVRRSDLVSINHRVAALIASYFDVLFAINRVLHPGEKRLVNFAIEHCPKLPVGMAEQVEEVLRATASVDPVLLDKIDDLLNNLDDLLKKEGFNA